MDVPQSARQQASPEVAPTPRSARKAHVYALLTDFDYSPLSFFVGCFISLCILLSTIGFIIETIPEMERSPTYAPYFLYAETFFVVLFTVELSLRYWSAPMSNSEFWKDPFNVIDILSILPFYVEIILLLTVGPGVPLIDLRVLRAFRLFRMLKVARFSSNVQLIGEALMRAQYAIILLLALLSLGIIFFSSIMWITERGAWDPVKQCFSRGDEEPHFSGCSPFDSIPMTFWWAITTMTTVGYGDTFPITAMGRTLGALAMISGILSMALPICILSVEFADLYSEKVQTSNPVGVAHTPRMTPRTEEERLAEQNLMINSAKIEVLRKELDAHLEWMKMVAIAHDEDRGVPSTVNPTFTLIQKQSRGSLESVRDYVRDVGEVKHSGTTPLTTPRPSARSED